MIERPSCEIDESVHAVPPNQFKERTKLVRFSTNLAYRLWFPVVPEVKSFVELMHNFLQSLVSSTNPEHHPSEYFHR